jgi:ubiquitin carboxyl-terminal hydrolase L3
MDQTPFKWPPLESDPEIFNNYFHTVGLPETVSFGEIYSLDYKEIQEITNPVLGVIVALRRNKKRSDDEEYLPSTDVPFYMKQNGQLDNACGLIAALHCIGNNSNMINPIEGSIIDDYFKASVGKTDEERARLLEKSDGFKQVHIQFAMEGQSEVPQSDDQVNHHFIAYVHLNGNVIELDGTIKSPVVVKKGSSQDLLLDDAIEDIRKRLMTGEINEDLSIIMVNYNI